VFSKLTISPTVSQPASVEAEQGKKPDCLIEVVDDKTDVDEVGDAGPMAVH
jgi:hypothetical protein